MFAFCASDHRQTNSKKIWMLNLLSLLGWSSSRRDSPLLKAAERAVIVQLPMKTVPNRCVDAWVGVGNTCRISSAPPYFLG